ncbi:MAG: energy-coupling factor transporter transmembrane component T [Eubacteriales bacterium]
MDKRSAEMQDMPQWLLKEENYYAQPDRDTFINKSILSLLGILSRIKTQGAGAAGKYSVNAAFKVAFTFLLLIMLSVSQSTSFVIVVIVYLLAALSLMEAKAIVKILKVSMAMTLFTFVILLPAAVGGNTYSGIMITSKVFAAITAVNILSRSTRWNSITSALKKFFVPDIFILVLDITIKYIVMLGDFVLNMLYALKLRSVGRNKSKYSSLSGIAGTMFIESKEMSEDMYTAMECRGFTGEYCVHRQFKFAFVDFAYIMMNIAIFLIFLYFGRT